MSESAPTSNRQSLLRALLADRLLQVGLVLYGLALLVLAASRAGSGDLGEASRDLVDPVLIGWTLFALLWGRSRLADSERRFWDLLALAWTCWLVVEFLYFLEIPVPLVSTSFVAEGLYLLYYMVFALAVDVAPHRSLRRTTPTSLGRRLESTAGLAAVFGLLIYFALVVSPDPIGLSLSFVSRERGLAPLLLVRLSLDLLILGRLVQAASGARGRWVKLYGLLAVGMVGYALRDTLSLLDHEAVISSADWGFGYEAFLYFPGFVILVAARARDPRLDGRDEPPASLTGDGDELPRPIPIGLYAMLVPSLHFLFYPLGFLDPASRNAREIFSLVYVLVQGAIAWRYHVVVARDNMAARAALKRAEERLVHSQRLESVGRLAGGIAHDFNNYLTVIRGYSEVLRERLRSPEEIADIERIEDAARKATNLTRQLLAVGRRQVLRARPLDLNAVVGDTSEMLRSLLGEDIALEVDLDPKAGFASADLGQTEQVLVNLAVNARDAMSKGGVLSIHTGRSVLDPEEAAQLQLEPGSYASIAVSDTGAGMSDEVRVRVFEPFFTTKEMGQGTGLGLSTVHGIVTQSGGAITVESAPGKGTRVLVLLPSAVPPAAGEPAPEPAAAREPEPPAARILVVEDEEAVRRLTVLALSRAGFRVSAASGGAEALSSYLDDCDSIELLITDVLMPDMDGVELAARFQSRRPGMRVLFVSGYPAETLREREAILPASVRILEKPFSLDVLVERAREALAPEISAAKG
ncbi:MAG: ATP-binding protein [Acidobacteriota bacterium]|nr:ATP-binding protein [Acidobacteriota bacterium]MDH3525274.1 ATP-binding protein [Acidobacteriota bacterium]